jgi:hypothetical protein
MEEGMRGDEKTEKERGVKGGGMSGGGWSQLAMLRAALYGVASRTMIEEST